MHWKDLDTPALLIDKAIMLDNIKFMKKYADTEQVRLRPHTKTHKMSDIAKLQLKHGACGITVAKVGEAEAMAAEGLNDIFIANQIVGVQKLERIKKLAKEITISFGVDSVEQIEEIAQVFQDAAVKANVLIEIEVGEKRSGVIEKADFLTLLRAIKKQSCISYRGVFSHDGHAYGAESLEVCKQLYEESVTRTLEFAHLSKEVGLYAEVISIGSTPSLMLGFSIPDEVTEIRPGTYIFMDASQANVIGTTKRCAASILTTVISRPTAERVITDVGAKGITAQTRSKGITRTKGLGLIKEDESVIVHDVYDEHAIIYDASFRERVRIGDKIRIIPNHICPVVNLHEYAYIIEGEEVVKQLTVTARGKLQ